MYCTQPEDDVSIRVAVSGKLIYHTVSCRDLFAASSGTTWDAKAQQLAQDPDAFRAGAAEWNADTREIDGVLGETFWEYTIAGS